MTPAIKGHKPTNYKGGRTARAPEARISPEVLARLQEELGDMSFSDWLTEKVMGDAGQVKNQLCHDCGCEEGELHELYCDMERCPFCGGQLISCTCAYKHFSIPNGPDGFPIEDLTEEQETAWVGMLLDKGRIPYILYPNLCARCGQRWPEFFRVPTEEWNHYIEPAHRHDMLCLDCYNQIKALIDQHQGTEEQSA